MCIPKLLYILSLVVVQNSSVVPDRIGYGGQWMNNNTPVVHAHSYMSGHEFYALRPDDIVTIQCRDGEVKQYTVTEWQPYAFGHPTDPWMLRVEGEWVYITDVIDSMAGRSDILLATCWTDKEGYGQITGRLYVLLKEVEDGLDFPRVFDGADPRRVPQ